MPAKILSLIPPQSFELVRDNIFQILSNEIPNQYALSGGDESLNASVKLERTIGVNHSEIPMVVVSMDNSDSSSSSTGSQSTVDSNPTVLYNIDCYQKSKSTIDDSGDTLARLRLHRLMGVVRAIMSDAQYKFLNPDDSAPSLKGIVNRGRIVSMQIAPTAKEDTTSTVMGRLVFEVRMDEIVEMVLPVTLEGSDTMVRFDLSDQGYNYTSEP